MESEVLSLRRIKNTAVIPSAVALIDTLELAEIFWAVAKSSFIKSSVLALSHWVERVGSWVIVPSSKEIDAVSFVNSPESNELNSERTFNFVGTENSALGPT